MKQAVETVTIADIHPDDRNANRGTERGAGMLEHSLRTYGAGRSILLDRNNRVIAGNKTLEQCGQIGLDNVAIIDSDGTKLVARISTWIRRRVGNWLSPITGRVRWGWIGTSRR